MDLGVDRPVPAVVAIDLHRGHLDPAVATMPLAPDRAACVLAANARFFQSCRAASIPIVHLLTQYRDAEEIASMPAWLARSRNPDNPRANVLKHNLAGMPGVAVMPQVLDAKRDWVVDTKKRYDCFIGTDLDFLLRTMDGPALHEAALACIRTAFGTVVRSDEIHKLQGLK
jgi:nicotinamidase-related amidase